MVVQSFQINNRKNSIESKKNLNRFDKILLYIIYVLDKIYSLKNLILRREEMPLNSNEEKPQDEFPFYEKSIYEIKNCSKMTEAKKNKIKKRKGNIIIGNYIIINLIKYIMINILCQIKSNIIIDLFQFQYSTISLKIKGKGYSNIFGNEKDREFNKDYYPSEVIINGNKQNTIEYNYYFNQLDNSVELIWHNNIDNCGYMFWNCSNITEINLFYFDTSRVTAMNSMFAYCYSLTSLNLTNLKTSQVKFMNWMFAYCSSLTSLNLSYFETSQVIDMNDMFCNCSSLTSLNLSNFDTSQLTNMVMMFTYCSSMVSLDLSNFYTSKVKFMHEMFSHCSSLTSLNLLNFDTSKVTNMTGMFAHCTSLTSLDLSNFDTSIVSDMNSMFNGCIKLEFINLKKFVEKELTYYTNMFYNVPQNIVICINEMNTRTKIFPQIKNTLICSLSDYIFVEFLSIY